MIDLMGKFLCRGYYPKGGGEVRISVNPIEHLNAVDLTEFGQIKRFFGRSFVAGTLSKSVRTSENQVFGNVDFNRQIAYKMAEAAEKLIHKQYSSNIPVEIEVVKEPENLAIGTATGIM